MSGWVVPTSAERGGCPVTEPLLNPVPLVLPLLRTPLPVALAGAPWAPMPAVILPPTATPPTASDPGLTGQTNGGPLARLWLTLSVRLAKRTTGSLGFNHVVLRSFQRRDSYTQAAVLWSCPLYSGTAAATTSWAAAGMSCRRRTVGLLSLLLVTVSSKEKISGSWLGAGRKL